MRNLGVVEKKNFKLFFWKFLKLTVNCSCVVINRLSILLHVNNIYLLQK